MNQPNPIIELARFVLEKASTFDDYIDEALEPIKDYTDTIGDIAAPVRSILSVISLSRKLAFKSFIKGYAEKLAGGYTVDDKEVKKLQKFFSKPENLKFSAEVIDSALQARSLKCSAILGTIAGGILIKKMEINDIDFIIVSSLREMTDIDLRNFFDLYLYIESYELRNTEKLRKDRFIEYRTRELYEKEGWPCITIDRFSLELTIEKLKRTGAITFGIGGIGSVGNAWGSFVFNQQTHVLYDVIIKSKVCNQTKF